MVSLRRTDLIVEIFNVTISKPTVNKGYLHFKVPKNLTFNSCVLQVFDKNAVVSGSLTIDIKYNTTADDIGMTSIFSVQPTLNFASISDYATSNGTMSVTSIASGSYLRLDVTSIPSGWIGNCHILFNAV